MTISTTSTNSKDYFNNNDFQDDDHIFACFLILCLSFCLACTVCMYVCIYYVCMYESGVSQQSTVSLF